jgi:hypothetical protein
LQREKKVSRNVFVATSAEMGQLDFSNPVSEHSLYLTLYASSAGGV